MKPADDIERIVNSMSFQAGPETDRRIWADAREAQEQTQARMATPNGSRLRRHIMRNPRMNLAAAAAITVAVVLSIGLWKKSSRTAYALEQTIEASHSVRCLEIREFQAGMEGPKVFRVEFD